MNKRNVLLSVILLLSLLFNTGAVSAQTRSQPSPQTSQSGTVVAWGRNFYAESSVPAGLNDAIANQSLALTMETGPVINLQPLDQAAYVGETVSFSAAASGDPAPSLQWQMSLDGGTTWTDVVDAIASPLTFTTSLEQDGNQYRAVFTNGAGSATSHAATLVFWEPETPFVYDDFNDNYVDPALWDVEELGGPTSSETNHRLEITMPADSAGVGREWGEEFFAWYTSACRLHGDYDIQVDYQLLTWPATNGVMLGLDDIHVSMGRANLGQDEYGGGHDVYWTHTTIDIDEGAFQLGNWIPTSDLSGKLRVQKVDDTIRTFYFGDVGWEPVGSNSDPVYAEDTPILIYGWGWDSGFGDQEVKLAYDNLTINHGELVCPSMYDDFNDNHTDPALWSMEEVGGPTSSETNQRLEITIPANSQGGEFISSSMSACQLHGDYDIQVDYQLLTWPLTSGVRALLGDDRVGTARVSLGQNDYDHGEEHEVYLTETYLNDVGFLIGDIISTNHLSGKLRMQRVGDTINTFYFRQWLWSPIASYSDPAYAEDTPMYLEAGSGDYEFGDQDVKVAFDNLMIYQGELVCPNTPTPDLTITQVADQSTVSTGDPIGFTITVTNNGDATAHMVTLTDTLPIYTELDWSIDGTDAAACLMVDGVVSCNFQDIEPGAVKTIRLTAPEYEYHSKCFSPIITSTATLMAYNQPVNKTATASVTVLCPYMFIDIYSDTNIVQSGDPVSYTVTFGNQGDGNAKDVDTFFDIQNAPGTSWEITDVTPSSAASSCSFGPYGSWMELECLFDQIAPLEEVSITFASPTTSESCGTFGAAGGLMASNNFSIKTKMHYITVNCPVGDTPPVITVQPQGQAVYVGDAAIFSAAASGDPAPSLQWQISTDSGLSWTDIAGATANPLTFTASLDQSGNQYRAVFTNSAGSTTSNAATLSVSKKSATVTLANLYLPYAGHPLEATVITDPAGLSVVVTYDGSPTAPTTAGSYSVVATINDATYEGSASGTLTIQKRRAYVTPYDAYKVYGTEGPVLSGFLVNFVEADGVTATYSRTPGEAVGSYTIIGALNPNEKLVNYDITYHTRTFTINPRPITVTADAKSKVAGEPDPSLTYQITGGSLAFSDAFSGALARDPGEEAGTYAIRQGTLALDSNYTLTYIGADLTILAASVNTAPVASPGGPYLGAINTAISFDGGGSSDLDGDPLTYAWTFGDGTASGMKPTHNYTIAGVYDVCLTVNDGTEDSEPVCTLAVVYDPSAGFVSGSGWIDSPAGAYKPDESLTGKAHFGFVSKYLKGAKVPTGTTHFQFSVAGFSFYSQTYEWLVVNQSGTNAQFKGSGTVNGTLVPSGNECKFMLWAGGGSSDTFRIRIWWEDAAGEHDVYDNGVAQAIGAGNIIVHTKK